MQPMDQLADSETGLEIAVVGLAGRFPGAPDIDAFWRRIRDGVSAVSRFTDEELSARGIPKSLLDDPSYVKAGVLFDGFEQFDAEFFGYSPREAAQLDPQQRHFLECAWEALEHAGYDAARAGVAVGVYAGAGANLYLMKNLLPRSGALGRDSGIAELIGLMNGNSTDSLATRVAYKLDLRGPAVTVQTACSTSLMAVHTACQALLSQECDMALAGGVWLNLLQEGGYRHQAGAILSSDGYCRAFDARADGTVLGSGAGVVVLKRLDDALRDGDTIHAVVKGSAANNDGADKVGYTAPSVGGQAAVIRAAHTIAGVSADSIGYVEAHGTGTTLGDPIEVAALTQAFRASTDRQGYCAIGSVKTNIGHLDAAAGIAGFIKTVMALRHRTLPPSLNFETPNPAIDFAHSPFRVNTQARVWAVGEGPRRAGVSSFGMGGTNVHVILEEAPAVEPVSNGHGPARPVLLALSARTAGALASASERLASHLVDHPDAATLDEVAHTLLVGRRRFAHRAVVLANDPAQAIQALRSRVVPQYIGAEVVSARPSVAFVFPGQGAQHVGMARHLYERMPLYRDIVDTCCATLRPMIDVDLRELLHAGPAEQAEASARLAQTAITQPALFVTEYAMARLWMSLGVEPDAMMGHSLGEYVAACLAGVFSLEDALALVAVRGRLMQSTVPGAMLAVSQHEEALTPFLRAGCDLAAVNAAEQCVLSGALPAIDAAERALSAAGVPVRRLKVSHAFHSSMQDPVLAEFEAAFRHVVLRPPTIPFVSNLTGRWITAEEACSPTYWVKHLRGAVRFADGLSTLLEKPDRIPLEVGPNETLSGLIRRHPALGARRPALASQAHPGRDDLQADAFERCAAGLWTAGIEAALRPVAPHALERQRRVPLPAYPFERQSFWVEPAGSDADVVQPPAKGRREFGEWFHVPGWKRAELPLPAPEPAAVGPVMLLGARECHLTRTLTQALADQGRTVVLVERGEAFARLAERHYAVRADERADHARLLAEVTSMLGKVTHICHLWTLGGDGAEAGQAQASGFFSLLAMAQAMEGGEEGGMAGPVSLTVVTDHLEDVTGDETVQPGKATLRGPCQVIPQEMPQVTCRLIDVAPVSPAGDAQARLAQALMAEMFAPADASVVAYRGGHRWLKTFEPVRRDQVVRQRLRQGGVYLITGGLGGVGLILAAHLARHWGAKLALLGRSALPDAASWPALLAADDTPVALRQQLQQMLALQAMTAEVLLLQADAGDAGQLRAAIDQARRRFGVIHGVIHAAGVDGGGLLGGQSVADVASVWRPKVDGTTALVEALAHDGLDFIVLCSSLAAVAGGLGKMAYSAANAYLDAYATSRRHASGAPVLAINWDGWRGVGMAAHMSMPDDVGIDAAQGAMAFERIVNGPDAPQTIVCTTALDDRLKPMAELLASAETAGGTASRQKHPRPPQWLESYVAPEGEIETALAGIWSDLLGMEPIGSADNLFEMGGDSLLAVQLVSRIRSQLKIDIPVKVVFDRPVLGALALALKNKQPQAAGMDFEQRHESDGRIPLSYAQQRLWFLWQLDPSSGAFNIPTVLDLTGPLDVPALHQALGQLVSRHAVLRTVFHEDDGKGWQVVQPDMPLALPVTDLSSGGVSAQDAARQVRARVAEVSREPFDLARGPLLRAEVIKLSAQSHVLLIVMHHVVTDGWSIRLLMRDFAQGYGAALKGEPHGLPTLARQYADFAVAQRRWLEGGEMARQAAYWKTRLAGVPPLSLQPDLPIPAQRGFPGDIVAFSVGDEMSARVKAFAREQGATPFMVLLGALSVVLSERAGLGAFYVGTDMANRNSQESESMVGFFVNQVALHIDCATPSSVAALLAQLQTTVVEAADHQDLPFDRLVEALSTGQRGGRAPLFQVKVIYQDDAEAGFSLPGLTVDVRPTEPGEAELDLIVSFLAGPTEVRVEIKYDREVYERTTIERLRAEFMTILAASTSDADMRLDSLRQMLADLRRAGHEQEALDRTRQLSQLRAGLKKPRASSLPSSS